MKGSRFGNKVEIDILTEESAEDKFRSFATDITSGRALVSLSGTEELVKEHLTLF